MLVGKGMASTDIPFDVEAVELPDFASDYRYVVGHCGSCDKRLRFCRS